MVSREGSPLVRALCTWFKQRWPLMKGECSWFMKARFLNKSGLINTGRGAFGEG